MIDSPRNYKILHFLCLLISGFIFYIDLQLPLGIAGGVPYIFVVLLSVKSPKKRFSIFIAVICSILVMIGFFMSPEGGEFWKVIINRLLALFAIWVTTLLALMQYAKEKALFRQHLKTAKAKRELALQRNLLATERLTKEISMQQERLKTLKSTMRTVQDIVGNFLANIQLFHLEIEEKCGDSSIEDLKEMEVLIQETAARLKKLADLDTVIEKEMATGMTGIEYEKDKHQEAHF